MIQQALNFATEAHTSTNHTYDGHPYMIHLERAVAIGYDFLHLVPDEQQYQAISALWLHDTIEDCRVSYNDLKTKFGPVVAEAVLAVTPRWGRNRKEKQGAEYYEHIRNTPLAIFVKLCDRIANAEYSRENNNMGKLAMYLAELPMLKRVLYVPYYEPLFARLDQALNPRLFQN